MNWVIPVGLGAVIAAVVITSSKKKTTSRVASNVDPRFRSRSPGQPQPPSYNPRVFARTVTFG